MTTNVVTAPASQLKTSELTDCAQVWPGRGRGDPSPSERRKTSHQPE